MRRLKPKAAASPSTGKGPGTLAGGALTSFTVRLHPLMLIGSLLAVSAKPKFQVPLPVSPLKALNDENGK